MKWRGDKAGDRDAVAPGRKTGDYATPCDSKELEIGNREAVRWHGLLEVLRKRADERRGFRPGRASERELQFRDVILKGPHDRERSRERELRSLLYAEFADTSAEFHTLSIDNGGSSLYAYFGNGVFAPEQEDRQVTDLDFSWFDPRDEARPVRPMLNKQDPAAWYSGQMGVAIGFGGATAPASLDGAEGAPLFPSQEAYLYMGRHDRVTAPVIEAYCSDMTASAICKNPEWWLADGEWQLAEISIGETNFKLWFRLTARTGDAAFRTGMPGAPDEDRARIVVRGLLMPELLALPRLRSLLSSSGVSGWTVEFDGSGQLRSNELCDLSHSVVARWGTRFGVYQHRMARWLPRSTAFDAQQSFDLPRGSQISHLYFPGESPDPHWRKIYGRKWSLLQFVDERPFGYLDVLPEATELVARPVLGTAVREQLHYGEAGEGYVGLDWINRAAHVNVGDRIIGLADYWCRTWRTHIEAHPEALDVTCHSLGDRGRSFRYQIKRGERGPLGPLYIEYEPY